MKNILYKIIDLIIPLHVFEGLNYSILYDNLLVDALKLWSLNLAFLLSFILVSPILIGDFSTYPEFFYRLFNGWFIDGFRFHLVIYAFCVLISSDGRYQ